MYSRLQGHVDWYNSKKGYGVIAGDDGLQYFVYHTDLNMDQRQLFAQEQVSFFSRPRKNRGGSEAFDIMILPLDLDSDAHDPISIIKRIHLQLRERLESKSVYHYWEEVVARYPEFQEPIEELALQFQLEIVPIDEAIIKKAFVPGDDMPVGALPKSADIGDWERRRGLYVCMRDDDITLIVHAFCDNPMQTDTCWRAKVHRHSDGRVFYMDRSWRERLGYFIADVSYLVRRAKSRQRPL